MKTWWKSQSKTGKWFYGVLVCVIVLAIIGSVVNLVKPSPEAVSGGAGQGEPSGEVSDARKDYRADAPFTEAEVVSLDDYEFEIDETGMVKMPVTDDPREAAAAAAAIAFTVEFDHYSYEEFFEEAISRMTYPSDEYQGPEGEIHTWVFYSLMDGWEREYLSPDEALRSTAMETGAFDEAEKNFRWWWPLAKKTTYDSVALIPDHSWVGTPIQVVDEAEMRELDEDIVPNYTDPTDMEPDTPGASIDLYWVLVDVDGSEAETAQPQTEFAASFGVWCDAPADGGLCGVAYSLNGGFPEGWPES